MAEGLFRGFLVWKVESVMRVLLIVPTSKYQYIYPSFLSVSDFPTGFAYLASALREAGHEVFGLNLNNVTGYSSAYEMIYDKIGRSLHEVHPALIGLGGLCTDYQFIRDALQIVRRLAPDVPIVCGGGIINNDVEYIFKLLRPDFCIIGEGEEIIVELANMLESCRQDYDQIENLGYWKNGIALFTKINFNFIDINQRPFPDYEPFGIREMLDKYSLATRNLYRYTRPYPRPMVIVTARGCPFNCTFCIHDGGPRYRARSVPNILQEISLMYERYDFNILVINDELFVANKQRMRDFCISLLQAKETHKWDFDWTFQTHANSSLDQEVLALAKKAGCYFFSYGLESASPRVLASMNKKTRIPQIVKAIEIADSTKLGFGGNFIFGDPAETGETIRETMNFFSQYCLDKHLFFGYIQPYPGSKLLRDCIERGLIKDKFQFYEHIDEEELNMTSIPHRIWSLWRYLFSSVVGSSLWVKPTSIIRHEVETDSANNPMVLHSGTSIWKIWTTCPHCGKDIFIREMVINNESPMSPKSPKSGSRSQSSFSTRAGSFLLKGAKVVVDGNARRLFAFHAGRAMLYFANYRRPIFASIDHLLGDRKPMPCLITGCSNCNKRFRINLPIDAPVDGFLVHNAHLPPFARLLLRPFLGS